MSTSNETEYKDNKGTTTSELSLLSAVTTHIEEFDRFFPPPPTSEDEASCSDCLLGGRPRGANPCYRKGCCHYGVHVVENPI